MKLENILSKYGIDKNEYTKNGRILNKIESSKKVNFLENEYYLDLDRFNDEFTSEIMLAIDDNDQYETMASLNIEGITSNKASSSKAKEAAEQITELTDDDIEKNNAWNDRIKIIKDTIDEMYQTLPEKKRPSKMDFYRDVGMNLALHHIEENAFEKITIGLITQIYDFLTLRGLALEESERLEIGSNFRKSGVNITDGFKTIDEGIPASEVDAKMNLLVELLSKETKFENHLLASLVHFLFVEIHPYYDGNGRMSRLLIKLISKSETSGGPWAKHINKVIDWTKNQYYKSIKFSRKTSDLTFFTIYMDWVYNISFFSEEIIFEEKQRLILQNKNLNELKSQIIVYLLTFSNIFISWKDIQKNVVSAKDMTEQGIKKALNEMEAEDILIKQKVDNNNMYKISKRISSHYNLI